MLQANWERDEKSRARENNKDKVQRNELFSFTAFHYTNLFVIAFLRHPTGIRNKANTAKFSEFCLLFRPFSTCICCRRLTPLLIGEARSHVFAHQQWQLFASVAGFCASCGFFARSRQKSEQMDNEAYANACAVFLCEESGWFHVRRCLFLFSPFSMLFLQFIREFPSCF